MNAWLDFLVGTPQRFIRTVVVSFILLMLVSETFRYAVLLQVQNLAVAAMGPVLLLVIIVYALSRILGPFWPGRRNRH